MGARFSESGEIESTTIKGASKEKIPGGNGQWEPHTLKLKSGSVAGRIDLVPFIELESVEVFLAENLLFQLPKYRLYFL